MKDTLVPDEKTSSGRPAQSLSRGFIVAMVLIMPVCLVFVNPVFFISLYTAHYGKDATAQVTRKDHHIYSESSGGKTYRKATYVLQIIIPPSRSTKELETTEGSWNKINVGQILRIKQNGSDYVAVDYPYADTNQFLICLGVVLAFPVAAKLLMRFNLNA